MKKRKKGRGSKTWTIRPTSQPPIIEIEPEDLVTYVRHAEKVVLPIIKEWHLSPAAAQFLLAQQTQILVTGDPRFTIESGRNMANTVLALWEAGYYTPGPEYPYTLEETLQEIQGELHAKGDYAESFQAFTPTKTDVPRGLGVVYGGIVKHPETNLWQVWMIVDGPCRFLGGFCDPAKAQKTLEITVNVIRRGGIVKESEALYNQVRAQEDGKPKSIPFDMIVYLVEHLDRYTIKI